MNDTSLVHLIAGMIAAGYLVTGLFFLRFWTRTRDSLFLAFALGFALMAIGQALPALLDVPRENLIGVYLLRLAAFCVIIVGIITKNLRAKR